MALAATAPHVGLKSVDVSVHVMNRKCTISSTVRTAHLLVNREFQQCRCAVHGEDALRLEDVLPMDLLWDEAMRHEVKAGVAILSFSTNLCCCTTTLMPSDKFVQLWYAMCWGYRHTDISTMFQPLAVDWIVLLSGCHRSNNY